MHFVEIPQNQKDLEMPDSLKALDVLVNFFCSWDFMIRREFLYVKWVCHTSIRAGSKPAGFCSTFCALDTVFSQVQGAFILLLPFECGVG